MLQIENDKIKDIYVGSDKIKEVYYESEKVWGEIESSQEGYWVHKNTGVITYFGLDDPSIVDGIMSPPSWKTNCSEVNIPYGVTGVGRDCFRDCSSLTSVTLPESVTSLEYGCFWGCSFTSISLPSTLTSIGEYCFRNCAITSITIPESIISLQLQCFVGCSSLILATVLPAIPPSLGAQAFSFGHSSFNIKVRSPYVNAYKAATNWNAYASKISAI